MRRPRRFHPLTVLLGAVPLWIGAVVLSVICSDCTGSDKSVAVPRPKAFPRIETYDTVMTHVEQALPISFSANAQADITIPDNASDARSGNRWFNIVYPRYNATIFCTITSVTPSNRQQVIDNRVERMSLNSGGLTTEITEITSPGGFHSQLLHTPAGSVTPLQFLSTDGDRWVISGALYLAKMPPATAADSIAPVVEAVKGDLVRSLTRLKAL